MKKTIRVISSIVIIIMLIGILPLGVFAESCSDNFTKVKTFNENQFTDVKSTDWFYDNLTKAYECGLVVGNSADTFNPNGNIKLSEAITIAARLNSIYSTGKDEFVQGTPWYQVYVDYSLENNILKAEYEDYNKAASRAEFAKIFASALPSEALEKINSVADDSIPDVSSSDDFGEAVYLLYRAGIVVGSDSEGTFNPSSNIKRSEVAAIASRMIDKTLRKTITLGIETIEEDRPSWDTNPYKLYVAKNGNDKNNGSVNTPFATIEAAAAAIRSIDKSKYTSITVYVGEGEYRTNQLMFNKEDSGSESCPVTYKAIKAGSVTITGGVSIPLESFSYVKSNQVLTRLPSSAKTKVRCFDLTSLSLTSRDWGDIQPVGSYNVVEFYAGYENYKDLPQSCQVSFDGELMTLARYPNEGYLAAGTASKAGHNATYSDFWYKTEHEGDTISLDSITASHVSKWSDLKNVWIYGYFIYDWADSATPIESYSSATGSLKTKFVSRYGVKANAPFYFYNILEELDTEGEWYLDREKGILYIYPPDGKTTGSVNISTSKQQLISLRQCNYLTFDGFVISNTRNNAVSIIGNNNTIKNCIVKNVTGDGIVVEGSNNLISKNEIAYTGNGGVIVSGGNTEKLIPGNNIVDNNYIHDWSQATQTYQGGIELHGVGNTASHNELYNAPHMAITYSGNNHVFEYNVIKKTCLLSCDGGVIYCGDSWIYYGNVFRYNLIANAGSDVFNDLGFTAFKANGIYFDDALSGQTAYGNILLNVPGYSFQLGGGRDLDIYNNIIITKNGKPFNYDSRAIDGVTMDNSRGYSWFGHSRQDGYLWQTLNSSPWKSEAWANAFPAMKKFSSNFSNTSNPNFVPNPANSRITGNLIIANTSSKAPLGDISSVVTQYSNISGNAVLTYNKTDLAKIFVSPSTGDYTLLPDSEAREMLPSFEDIPCSEIGRYDW